MALPYSGLAKFISVTNFNEFEGSGSGDDSDDSDDDEEGSGGGGGQDDRRDEPEVIQQAWPPWEDHDTDNTDPDIEFAEDPQRAPEISIGSAGSALYWTVVHFALPVFVCCLGSLL